MSLSPKACGVEAKRIGARLPDGDTGCLCLVSEGRDDDSEATLVVTPIPTSYDASDRAVREIVADWKVKGRSSSSSADEGRGGNNLVRKS